MARDVLILQHEAVEGPGRIGEALQRRQLEPVVIRRDLGQALPDPREINRYLGLVVLGGSSGIADIPTQPALGVELQFVTHAMRTNIPTLGICLGSQLMAAALGSEITQHDWELGWHPVTRRAGAAHDNIFMGVPSEFAALHWHRDRFSPPPGATQLASTPPTECQAFSIGPHLGMLFHLEADAAQTAAMANSLPEDLTDSGVTPGELATETDRHSEATGHIAATVFGNWTDLMCRQAGL